MENLDKKLGISGKSAVINPVKEMEFMVLNEQNPERIMKIGSQLLKEQKRKIEDALKKNIDVFT